MIVVDGERKLGNQFCLPAGPLREPMSKLTDVDLLVTTGVEQTLIPHAFYQVKNTNITQALDYFQNKTVHAVAGIRNPQRFFKLLREMGLTVIEHAFPDHQIFQPKDLCFGEDAIILMTEKDAVKCEKFAGEMFGICRYEQT